MLMTMEVRLSFLKDRAGLRGITFELSEGPTYAVKYASPEPTKFDYGDKVLSVASAIHARHGKHSAELNEDAVVLLEPIGERLPTELGGQDIQTIQNLITFATDKPNAIEGMTYYGKNDENDIPASYHLVFDPLFRVKDEQEMLHPSDVLFTLQDVH
jgi:hypothetical protein